MGKNRTSFGRYATTTRPKRSLAFRAGQTAGHYTFFLLLSFVLAFKVGVILFILWLLYELVMHYTRG